MSEPDIQQLAPLESNNEEVGESFFYRITQLEAVKVAILGLLVGLSIALFSYLAQRYFILPVFCEQSASGGICAATDMTAYYVTTVVATVAATVALVNWQIFRPLVIAVAAAAALWGFKQNISTIADQSWLEYGAITAIVYMLAYTLSYWLMRVRSFVVSVILSVMMVLAIRWLLIV